MRMKLYVKMVEITHVNVFKKLLGWLDADADSGSDFF